MEPCQYCGQQAPVDPAGFCTNCRNYRGVPAQPVATGGYPPAGDVYGAPYPTSGPAYGQVSGPPVTGAPYSAPPAGYPAGGYPPPSQPYSAPPSYGQPTGYPVSGAPTPVSGPAGFGPIGGPIVAPPAKQRSLAVPIIALCSVLALLVIGIVIVGISRSGGHKGTTGTTASGLDRCLVGKWRVTSSTIKVPLEGVGNVDFTLDSSSNYTFTTDEDGQSVDDYGTEENPATFVASDGGTDYQYLVWGTFTYTLRSANGVLSFENGHGDGKYAWVVDGDRQSPYTRSDDNGDPTPYTCTSTTLTQKTNDFEGIATRIS